MLSTATRTFHKIGQVTFKVNASQIQRNLCIRNKLHQTPLAYLGGSLKRTRICVVLLPLTSVSCAAISTHSALSSKADLDDSDNMSSSADYKNANSIYDFTVKDTHGNDVSLEQYKGNVVLVVNIASQCGLTKNNYKKLTDLKEKYGDKGLKILNFPCNQFGSQMPEGDGEAMVCHLRDAKADIGDVFQKIDVNGSGTAPLYQYLKSKQGGLLGSSIKWNFKDSPHHLSIIIKRQIPSLSRRQLYRCDEAFSNEINAYRHVVPLLEKYIKDDSFFPKCYFAGTDDLGDIIILEDLKVLGYRMPNRLCGLELSYCELVMKQLAKLHAASIAAKQLNHKVFSEKSKHIRDIVYCKDAEEFYKNLLESSIQESLSSLRASNVDDSLTEPIRLIEKLQTKLFRQIQSCITNSKESLNVMCHGDLWMNNMMFVSTTDLAEMTVAPYNVKFFDLQAMRYTSPVYDILHFIYTSTKRELRDKSTLALLETYCLALFTNLEQLLAPVAAASELDKLRNTFSLSNITAEYYNHVLYGLAISMWILPAVTFDPHNIPNLDMISEFNRSAKEIKCTQKLTPEYHSRLRELALEFYQNGFLNNTL